MHTPQNGEPVNGGTLLDRIGRLFPRTNKFEFEYEDEDEFKHNSGARTMEEGR
jgi:hypothetical protein